MSAKRKGVGERKREKKGYSEGGALAVGAAKAIAALLWGKAKTGAEGGGTADRCITSSSV